MSFKSHEGDDYDRYRARRLICIIFVALLFLTFDATLHIGQEKVYLYGVTEAIKDVTLSLSVAGTVSSIFVKEGSTVKRGQIILELDKKLEELEVARRKLIWESKAELIAAKARVLTMKSRLESTRKLFEEFEGNWRADTLTKRKDLSAITDLSFHVRHNRRVLG